MLLSPRPQPCDHVEGASGKVWRPHSSRWHAVLGSPPKAPESLCSVGSCYKALCGLDTEPARNSGFWDLPCRCPGQGHGISGLLKLLPLFWPQGRARSRMRLLVCGGQSENHSVSILGHLRMAARGFRGLKKPGQHNRAGLGASIKI